MDKCIYNGVDIFNPINGNIKHFVNAFTKVYGEKYREVIEKRLRGAKYFFHRADLAEIAKKYSVRLNEEIEKIKTYNLSPSLKKYKTNEAKEKYNRIIKIFADAALKTSKINEKYINARIDYFSRQINLIRSNNGLAPFSEKNLIKQCNTYYDIINLGVDKLLYNKILLSEQKKTEYTELFKSLGYNEPNFDSYLKNYDMLNNIFNQNLMNQLLYWEKTQQEELTRTNFLTNDFIKQFKELQVYGDEKQYLDLGIQYIQGKSLSSAFVVNCLSYKTGFTTLCFCKNGINLNIEDLTHEMGHIIDAFVVESNNQGYYHKSGFELYYYGFTPESIRRSGIPGCNSKDFREAELFNEMINEYICLQVADEVLKCGKTIVFGSRGKGKSKYSFGFEIFEDFLKKYQNKLIELKMTVDKQESAYKFFGEKNLKKLFSIAKNYINKRTDLNYRQWFGDQDVFAEIEELKATYSKELAEVEKDIEKNILKQNLESNKDNESSKVKKITPRVISGGLLNDKKAARKGLNDGDLKISAQQDSFTQ